MNEEEIKRIRLENLQVTDWMANSDYTMPSYIKTWSQSLRDIPTNHTEFVSTINSEKLP